MDFLDTLQQGEDTLQGKYLFFAIGEELYGIEIRYIVELIGMQPVTPLPEMPPYVKGIMNLRGKTVLILDARLRFRKPEKAYDDKTCIVVLDVNGIAAGLIVDRVTEVMDIADEDIAPPPKISGAPKYVKGICRTGGSIKLLLDCQSLLTDEEAELFSEALKAQI